MALLFSSNFNDGFTGWTKTTTVGTITEVNSGGRTFARHNKASSGWDVNGLRLTTAITGGIGHTVFFNARHDVNFDGISVFTDSTTLDHTSLHCTGYNHDSANNAWQGFPFNTTNLSLAINTWANFKIIITGNTTADIYGRVDDGIDPTKLPLSSFTLLQHATNVLGSGLVGASLYWQTNLFTGTMNLDIGNFRWYNRDPYESLTLNFPSGINALVRTQRKKLRGK